MLSSVYLFLFAYPKDNVEEEVITAGYEQRLREGVYVLKEIPSGIFYVGKSFNINRRIGDHKSGDGARCISSGSICEVPPITEGSVSDMESWERNETLELMKRHGITKVRGWMFTSSNLSDDDIQAAFRQICEKFDLCRRCGHESHFAEECRSTSKSTWAVASKFIPLPKNSTGLLTHNE